MDSWTDGHSLNTKTFLIPVQVRNLAVQRQIMKYWICFKQDEYLDTRNCGAEINLIDRRLLREWQHGP